MVPPYSSTEVAMAIGVSLDTFYRILSHAPNPARARRLASADQRTRAAQMGTHRLRCLAHSISSHAPEDDR